MKIEDAIERIKEIKTEIDNWRDNLGEGFSDRDIKDFQAYDLAISALEKQIPKEPTKVTYFNDGSTEYGNCPVCDDGVSDYGNYCPHCGQALKW